MADRVMPLLDAPTTVFKKITMQLLTRVLEGTATRGNFYFPKDMPRRIALKGDFSDKSVKVRFTADSLRDEAEAAIILDLLQRPYVEKIVVRAPVTCIEIQIFPADVQTLQPADLIGQFSYLSVVCKMDLWDRDCLNEIKRPTASNEDRSPTLGKRPVCHVIMGVLFAIVVGLLMVRVTTNCSMGVVLVTGVIALMALMLALVIVDNLNKVKENIEKRAIAQYKETNDVQRQRQQDSTAANATLESRMRALLSEK